MKNTICKCGQLKDRRSIQCRTCRDTEPVEKACNACGKLFPIGNYSLRPNGRGGHKRRSRCKSCEASSVQQYRKDNKELVAVAKRKYAGANPDKVRRWGFRTSWKQKGFNPDDAERFIAERNNKCEICGCKPTAKALCLDHCHATKKFRGVLCSNCNAGIGMFKDNTELMVRAIDYIKSSEKK